MPRFERRDPGPWRVRPTRNQSAVERRCTRRNASCSTTHSAIGKGAKQTSTVTDPDTTGRYSIGSGSRCLDGTASRLISFKSPHYAAPRVWPSLHDMMALYQKCSEVEYRPCLEPDKCCCRKDDPKRSFDDPTASYHWSHRYTCYKRNCSDIYDFSELCFLYNEWGLVPKPGTTTTKIV